MKGSCFDIFLFSLGVWWGMVNDGWNWGLLKVFIFCNYCFVVVYWDIDLLLFYNKYFLRVESWIMLERYKL